MFKKLLFLGVAICCLPIEINAVREKSTPSRYQRSKKSTGQQNWHPYASESPASQALVASNYFCPGNNDSIAPAVSDAAITSIETTQKQRLHLVKQARLFVAHEQLSKLSVS